MDQDKTDFIIGDQVVEGTLILEKNTKDKDAEYSNVRVYKLDHFEPEIPFDGTSTVDIEKEFPDKKFSIEEIFDKYIMFRDENPVIDGFD